MQKIPSIRYILFTVLLTMITQAHAAIKSINDLRFTYAPDYSWNKNSGVVGKLTQIGNIKITYWTDAGYTERGKYRGKIKSFGNKEFKYEGWSSWGEKVGMIGRLKSLGTLKINYYQTDYDTVKAKQLKILLEQLIKQLK